MLVLVLPASLLGSGDNIKQMGKGLVALPLHLGKYGADGGDIGASCRMVTKMMSYSGKGIFAAGAVLGDAAKGADHLAHCGGVVGVGWIERRFRHLHLSPLGGAVQN